MVTLARAILHEVIASEALLVGVGGGQRGGSVEE